MTDNLSCEVHPGMNESVIHILRECSLSVLVWKSLVRNDMQDEFVSVLSPVSDC